MASAVASKAAQQAALLRKLLAAPSASGGAPLTYALRPTAGAGARRFFNTGGQSLRRYDNDSDLEDSSDDDAVDGRRRARNFSSPMFFSSDVFDSYRAPKTLSGLLALMEDAVAPGTGSGGLDAAAARRGWWVAKEDDDAVVLKVPMPGLGKEHVKVLAEKSTLVVKGEGDKETEDGDDDFEESGPPRYTLRLDVPSADKFKMDQLKAEMKNGMLRVTVPKVKEEERKDVFVVKVE